MVFVPQLSLFGPSAAVSILLTAAFAVSQPAASTEVVNAGRQVYLRECASCHGESATGYGRASWILRQRPPDLTRFTDRTVPFPREMIRNRITGHIRLQPGHGTEMPYWRKSLNAGTSVPGVTQIEALLDYLSSIQRREFGPYRGPSAQTIAAAGKPLFATYCAACHGTDGRGPAERQYTVGISMDLTTIASRNAGAFELRRVYESIARCGDDWPTSDMPSWQRFFTEAGWGDYLTMKQLEFLATYVESIQR